MVESTKEKNENSRFESSNFRRNLFFRPAPSQVNLGSHIKHAIIYFKNSTLDPHVNVIPYYGAIL